MDIDRWSQPHGNVVFLHFRSACRAYGFNHFRIPTAREKSRAGPACSIHAALGRDTKSCGAVGRHNGGHPVLGQIAVSESIGNPHIGLAAQNMRHFLVR